MTTPLNFLWDSILSRKIKFELLFHGPKLLSDESWLVNLPPGKVPPWEMKP